MNWGLLKMTRWGSVHHSMYTTEVVLCRLARADSAMIMPILSPSPVQIGLSYSQNCTGMLAKQHGQGHTQHAIASKLCTGSPVEDLVVHAQTVVLPEQARIQRGVSLRCELVTEQVKGQRAYGRITPALEEDPSS